MAVTIVEAVAEFASTANASTYTTASFDPGQDCVLCAVVGARGTLGGSPQSFMTGGALPWVLHGDPIVSGSDTFYLFYALVAGSPGPGAMTATFDCTGDAATGCTINLFKATGHDPADPIRQRRTNSGAAGTTPSVNFLLNLNSDSGYGAAGWNSSNPAAIAPPASWTEIADAGFNNPATGVEACLRSGGETGSLVTWGSTSATAWFAMAFEVRAQPLGVAATLSMDSAIQRQLTLTPAMNAALQVTASRGAALSAALAAGRAHAASLAAALAALRAATVSLQAALQTERAAGVTLDAALLELRLAAALLDAMLARLVALGLGIDAALFATALASVGLDASIAGGGAELMEGRKFRVPPRDGATAATEGGRHLAVPPRGGAIRLSDGRTYVVPPRNRRH